MQHSCCCLIFPLVDCLLLYSTHWLLPNNALHCCCLLSPLVNCSLLPMSLEPVWCQGGCHHLLCHDSCCATTVLPEQQHSCQCCCTTILSPPFTMSLYCHCPASLHFSYWPLPWPLVGCCCYHDHNHCPPSCPTILLSGNSSWQLWPLPLHCYPIFTNSLMLSHGAWCALAVAIDCLLLVAVFSNTPHNNTVIIMTKWWQLLTDIANSAAPLLWFDQFTLCDAAMMLLLLPLLSLLCCHGHLPLDNCCLSFGLRCCHCCHWWYQVDSISSS